MKLTLILDTSIFGVSLALLDLDGTNTSPLWQQSILNQGSSTQNMTMLLEEGLKSLNLDISNLKYLALSTGPGTFTGIKVGISWAHGLFAGLEDLKLLSLSSLAESTQLLNEDSKDKKPTAVFLRTTKTHGYICYQDETNNFNTQLININAIKENSKFEQILRSHFSLIINDWELLNEYLNLLSVDFKVISFEDFSALSIRSLSLKAISSNKNSFLRELVQPNYLRKSTAEEKLDTIKGVKKSEFA